MKGCKKCGNPVYVKPDGSDAVLCADCIMVEFENLGIFPKDQAVQQPLAPDLGWTCGKCKTHNADGVSLCGFCDSPRLSG